MQKITPFLWFDGNAEEAMNFYTSIFRNAKVGSISRYGEAGPGPAGSVLTASFELEGLQFTALNGGPHFKFNEAISFHVACESQDEVDYFWDRLGAGRTDAAMRLAQGQVRRLLADRPDRAAATARRSRPHQGEPRDAGHAADEEARHRGVGALRRIAFSRTGVKAVSQTATLTEFAVTRSFNAPRERVWRAWTDAQALAQWWGPKGAKIRVIRLDLRPGGVFHYAMAYQPGHEIYGRFIFREIAAPHRLVFVNSFSDADGGITRAPFPQLDGKWPLEVLNTVTLTEQGGMTTLNLRGGPIDATEAERKVFDSMHESMRQGFGGTFDQLAGYLAKD
jgi:predicted 3-demethylubiquinone-9 3-methyltransferase (glyoxalase superfamily)/uncharacterized protein YndB with AHSA1/START domain